MKNEKINYPFNMKVKLQGKEVVFTTCGKNTILTMYDDDNNVNTWDLDGITCYPEVESDEIRFKLTADMRGHLTLKIDEAKLLGRMKEEISSKKWKWGRQ